MPSNLIVKSDDDQIVENSRARLTLLEHITKLNNSARHGLAAAQQTGTEPVVVQLLQTILDATEPLVGDRRHPAAEPPDPEAIKAALAERIAEMQAQLAKLEDTGDARS